MSDIKALYPVFADLSGRSVLVVGGGRVAERKVCALLDCGAVVHVGSPTLTAQLRAWAREGRLRHLPGRFRETWLEHMWLVIAATNQRAVNMQVKDAADLHEVFANVVDDPALSSFQVPSVVDRRPVTIAISSAGVAPVLARRLRERMEALFDHAIGDLAALAGKYRPSIRKAYPDAGHRRRFYDWLFDGPVLQHLRRHEGNSAEAALRERLENPEECDQPILTLIDLGTGHPGQLTLDGLRALNEADAVAFDDGVGESLLSMARRDADRHALGIGLARDPYALAEYLAKLSTQYRRVALLATPTLDDGGRLRAIATMTERCGIVLDRVP